MHLAHPLGVALGQIVVDGDDVDTLAAEGVEVGRQRSHQSLTFTGFHLSDAALMKDNTTHQLHPVGVHTENAACGLTRCGESLGQNVVQRLTVGEALLEFGGLCLQLCVRHGAVAVGQSLDLVNNGVNGFQFTLAVSTKNLLNESHIY